MQYCLDIKSSFKFGLNFSEPKYILKKTYENKLPGYILNKSKTGWSAPIMNWLYTEKSLKDKFDADVSKDDGIREIISETNFFDDPKLGKDISGKRKVISWMLRSWAQEFKMSL